MVVCYCMYDGSENMYCKTKTTTKDKNDQNKVTKTHHILQDKNDQKKVTKTQGNKECRIV